MIGVDPRQLAQSGERPQDGEGSSVGDGCLMPG